MKKTNCKMQNQRTVRVSVLPVRKEFYVTILGFYKMYASLFLKINFKVLLWLNTCDFLILFSV